jgi:hypothetical protein
MAANWREEVRRLAEYIGESYGRQSVAGLKEILNCVRNRLDQLAERADHSPDAGNMVTDEMVERAAVSLASATWARDPALNWKGRGEVEKDDYRRRARASLAAALNPTPGDTKP